MKTSGIFLILLIFVVSYSNAQRAFTQINTLLTEFKNSNIKEQHDADIREKKERTWCRAEIGKLQKELAVRQNDVISIEKHILYLQGTIKEYTIDVAHRQKRIKDNEILLKKFKKQRCDNNLLFVKNLRDHIEAIDVLKLLRQDIVNYFNSKRPKIILPAPAAPTKKAAISAKKATVFVEAGSETSFKFLATGLVQKIDKLSEYEHLFDDENKLILVELKRFSGDVSKETRTVDSITSTHQRTNKQIGTGHVDNSRGALKRLATPEYEGSAAFNSRAEKRILGMIDGLIHHLKESREKLTKDEIQAALDFAVFQSNMLKENEHLVRTIARLTLKIKTMSAEVIVSQKQLAKRKILVEATKRKLAALRKLCAAKYAYFLKETLRRKGENKIIDQAVLIFHKLVARSSKYRASRRSSANFEGAKYGKADNVDGRVLKSEGGISTGLSTRQKSRNALAY